MHVCRILSSFHPGLFNANLQSLCYTWIDSRFDHLPQTYNLGRILLPTPPSQLTYIQDLLAPSHRDHTKTMSTTRVLQSITVPATTKHTATVIFLHGLGDSGAGWAPVARLLSRNPKLHHIKWILPHAPVQRVTLNMGMSMPSWFDIASLDADLMGGLSEDGIRADRSEDQQGILSSALAVSNIITKEVDDGIDSKKIVVGGFSQGAALTLVTGLTSERRLGGLVCLSGWLPMSGKMKSVSGGFVWWQDETYRG